jgi:hypothetical protein
VTANGGDDLGAWWKTAHHMASVCEEVKGTSQPVFALGRILSHDSQRPPERA